MFQRGDRYPNLCVSISRIVLLSVWPQWLLVAQAALPLSRSASFSLTFVHTVGKINDVDKDLPTFPEHMLILRNDQWKQIHKALVACAGSWKYY